jgi:polyisoprenoid-binding protein YceI
VSPRTCTALSIAAVTLVTGFAANPALADEIYVLDGAHSEPSFLTRHLGISTQRGRFETMTGQVSLDRAEKRGSVEVTIDAASVRTHSERLDAIVKGDRFFNVAKYPTITFKSSNVTFEGDRVVSVNGELTMLGVTKPVELAVTDFVCQPQPFNQKPMCGGDATATIRRSDGGMTAGLPLAPADKVTLEIPFEGYLK